MRGPRRVCYSSLHQYISLELNKTVLQFRVKSELRLANLKKDNQDARHETC